MCHLILMMPVLGLVVFWVWLPQIAIPVYAGLLLLSGLIYFALLRAMQQPVKTGVEGMIGLIGEVIDPLAPRGHVLVHGEIWKAESTIILDKGEWAEIIDTRGLILRVRKVSERQKHCPI